MWLWLGVCLVVVGAIFNAFQWRQVVDHQLYAREGRKVDGIVVTKAIRRATRPGSTESETSYSVTYRFLTDDGSEYEGEQDVSSGMWETLREYVPIRIQYVASAPSTSRLAGQVLSRFDYAYWSVGSFAMLIGLALVIRSVRTARRA